MKRVLFAGAIVLGMSFMTSCTTHENPKCFISYTADTLDKVTIFCRDLCGSGLVVPREDALVDSLFNVCAALSYEEYAGAIPQFSEEKYDLDTLVDTNGWKTLKVTCKGVTPEFDLMFLHSGGFFMNFQDSDADFVKALMDRVNNAAVYLPLYPLAPTYRVNDGLAMILDVYKKMLADGRMIYIMGDSAGANLTMTFTLYLKDLGLKLPDAIFPISTIADFTMDNPDLIAAAPDDPMLIMSMAKIGQRWMEDGMDYKDPRVSPLFGDLKGMPKTLFFVGSRDLFAPDEMLLYEKMKSEGVEVGMLYGKGLWHVAAIFPMPAEQQYLDLFVDFIK